MISVLAQLQDQNDIILFSKILQETVLETRSEQRRFSPSGLRQLLCDWLKNVTRQLMLRNQCVTVIAAGS